MSIIKPRTRGKAFVPYRTRLDRENHETLYAYAAFIDEDPEYVVNAVIDTVLAKDKEFAAWRADHGESFVPSPSPPAPTRVRRRDRGADDVRTTGDDAGTRSPTRDRTV
jgi:hypothetical protein